MLIVWEGRRESRRCSREAYPELYITKDTHIQRCTSVLHDSRRKNLLRPMIMKKNQELFTDNLEEKVPK